MLTDREKQWVLDITSRRGSIAHVREVHGGVTAHIHQITVRSRRGKLVRLILKSQKHSEEWWPLVFEREAWAIEAAHNNGIPSPRVLGVSSELPAVLMTRLPGKVHLAPKPRQWIEVMARTLKAIHDVPPSAVKPVQRYKPSGRVLDANRIPSWTKVRPNWEQIILLAN